MQLSVRAQQLEIERALVLGDAAQSLTAAQSHGDCSICRGAAATTSARGCNRRSRAGIAQRFFDLSRILFTTHSGQIGANDAASTSYHVAARAALRPKYPLAGDGVPFDSG